MRRILLVLSSAAMLAFTAAMGVSAAQTGDAAGNTCDSGTVGLNSAEQRMLELHNQARADNGLAPLCAHPILTEAARVHSQDMIERGYHSHTSPDGETYPARLGRFGYVANAVGENIGWGSGPLGEPDAVFEEWMNSSGHRGNILNENFRDIGIGASTGTYEGYDDTTMYTVDFGSGQRESDSTTNETTTSEPPPTDELDDGELPPQPTNEMTTNDLPPPTNETMSDTAENNTLEQANNALEQARQWVQDTLQQL